MEKKNKNKAQNERDYNDRSQANSSIYSIIPLGKIRKVAASDVIF